MQAYKLLQFEGGRLSRIFLFLWSFLLDIVVISQATDEEKDLEILPLRHQLRIVDRQQVRGPTIPRWQKLPLIALAVHLKTHEARWRELLAASLLLFKPNALLKWHRDLVRRKWAFDRRGRAA